MPNMKVVLDPGAVQYGELDTVLTNPSFQVLLLKITQDSLILNSNGTGQTDFVDSDSDGLADYWEVLGAS